MMDMINKMISFDIWEVNEKKNTSMWEVFCITWMKYWTSHCIIYWNYLIYTILDNKSYHQNWSSTTRFSSSLPITYTPWPSQQHQWWETCQGSTEVEIAATCFNRCKFKTKIQIKTKRVIPPYLAVYL